jgi:hypothetical protein
VKFYKLKYKWGFASSKLFKNNNNNERKIIVFVHVNQLTPPNMEIEIII